MQAMSRRKREVRDMSRDAVIVSVARTPIGRAYKGAFNATPAPTLADHAIRAAIARANVEPDEIEDCIVGSALPQGLQHTIGRNAALAAGLPVSVPGQTVDRQCSSGLMSISMASKQVVMDRIDIVVAGGMDSISLVQTSELRLGSDPGLLALHRDIYMPMIDTGDRSSPVRRFARTAGRVRVSVAAPNCRGSSSRPLRCGNHPC
jgi:acetyl-CoA C-acetyltransferase